MNATQLKKWKEKKIEDEHLHVKTIIKNENAERLKDVYQDLKLQGSYTTSLEPHIPIWAQLPFFDKIIVGVLPYIRTEEDFIKWYGISVKQLLLLEESGRVRIRLIFPRSATTIPKYLNHFFYNNYPTTRVI